MNIIDKNTVIGNNLCIGNFNQIEKNVTIGDNVKIGNNVRISSGTIIGDDVKIFDGVIIGTEPQDLKYNNEIIRTVIGNGTTIREYVTINGGSKRDTKIGENCYLMVYSHVSHDTILGKKVILANCVEIGGNSFIDDYAFIGGSVSVHQNSNIGKYCMVGGFGAVRKDILPFFTVGGTPFRLIGINKLGLKRNGKTTEEIEHICDLYKKIKTKLTIEILEIFQQINTNESQELLTFIKNSKRGLVK